MTLLLSRRKFLKFSIAGLTALTPFRYQNVFAGSPANSTSSFIEDKDAVFLHVPTVRVPDPFRASPGALSQLLASFEAWLGIGEECPPKVKRFPDNIYLLRPKDFLSLQVEFLNLYPEWVGGELRLYPQSNQGHLLIHLPPQHIAEQSFYIDPSNEKVAKLPNPVASILSNPSRIAWKIEKEQWIEVSESGLLNWDKFLLEVHEAAVPPNQHGKSNGSRPELWQTALELPFGLILSPPNSNRFRHSSIQCRPKGVTECVTSEVQRMELWHTDLAPASLFTLTLRALSYTKEDPPLLNSGSVNNVAPRGFLPEADTRKEIVALTSNFNLINDRTGKPETEPIYVSRLMLSSLGAYAKLRGVWDAFNLEGPSNPKGSFKVVGWDQESVWGRDQFVKVTWAGYLFPLGVQAVIVETEPREFLSAEKQPVLGAFLRRRYYCQVLEPDIAYAEIIDGQDRIGRKMCFRRVRFKTLTTSALKIPIDLGTGQEPRSLRDLVAAWLIPEKEENPFKFDLIGVDWASPGYDHAFSMPLMFVNRDLAEKLEATYDPDKNPTNIPGCIISQNAAGKWVVPLKCFKDLYDNDSRHLNEVPVRATKITIANPGFKDDPRYQHQNTALLVNKMKFSVDLPDGILNTGTARLPEDWFNRRLVRFYPAIEQFSVRLEAVERLVGSPVETEVSWSETYRKWGFISDKNKGEVFVTIDNGAKLNFPGSKSGGLALPSMNITDISRLIGPVGGDATKKLAGNPNVFVKGNFNPKDFFGGVAVTLLGGIDLTEVIQPLGDINNALDEVPKLISKAAEKLDVVLEELKKVKGELRGKSQSIQNQIEGLRQTLRQIREEIKAGREALQKAVENKDREIQKQINDSVAALRNAREGFIQTVLKELQKRNGTLRVPQEQLDVLRRGLDPAPLGADLIDRVRRLLPEFIDPMSNAPFQVIDEIYAALGVVQETLEGLPEEFKSPDDFLKQLQILKSLAGRLVGTTTFGPRPIRNAGSDLIAEEIGRLKIASTLLHSRYLNAIVDPLATVIVDLDTHKYGLEIFLRSFPLGSWKPNKEQLEGALTKLGEDKLILLKASLASVRLALRQKVVADINKLLPDLKYATYRAAVITELNNLSSYDSTAFEGLLAIRLTRIISDFIGLISSPSTNSEQPTARLADQEINAILGQLDAGQKYLENLQSILSKIGIAYVRETNQMFLALNNAHDQILRDVDNVKTTLLAKIAELATPLIGLLDLIQTALKDIPKEVEVAYDWKPRLKSAPAGQPLFEPRNLSGAKEASFTLKVLIRKSLQLTELSKPPSLLIEGELNNFTLHLMPSTRFISVGISRLRFESKDGQQPTTTVEGFKIELGQALGFVTALAQVFDLPPEYKIDLSSEGLTVGYEFSRPQEVVGGFLLIDLFITAKVMLSFQGGPLTVYMGLGKREAPIILITPSGWAGGAFFGIQLTPRGVSRLEGAFEFGGALAFDLGVASGQGVIMAGIYFSISGPNAVLTGYVRAAGRLTVIGLISLTLEFYLGLTYGRRADESYTYGEVTVKVGIKIAFFKVKVGVRYYKEFSGDPNKQGINPSLLPSPNGTEPYEDIGFDPYASDANWGEYSRHFIN